MSAENEIKAMGAIAAAIEGLEGEARARVLLWAIGHFGVAVAGLKVARHPSSAGVESVSRVSGDHETFADLFSAMRPRTERDKALVAAYWTQVCQGAGSFQAQSLNEALKDLGHRIGNITEALNQLKDDRPALVLQLKKSGNTRQARKTYKLTQAGVARVEEMIQNETESKS
ncbi:MAG: hypothetical protein K9G60_14920 [Pseudolabrys sp.]|nr:hypothetical protein [Pseudolabrys sp.]